MQENIFMKRAIYLASRASHSFTRSNPRVGAVMVYNNHIIGEGYHHEEGKAHAEVNCIQSIKPSYRPFIPESTMYVTLEPCAHQGRTPSCARMLADLRVKKVVIGTLDPFPKVAGKGCTILREAGIEIEVGLLEKECREVATVFLTNQASQRPFIILKWAESSDGFIDASRSDSTQASTLLSTPFTQLLTHRLRGECMGILIGSRTALLDRPSLTNRLWKGLPSPKRMILSGKKTIIPNEYLGANDWQIISQEGDLKDTIKKLYQSGITTLLVEGGASIHNSFIEAGLWDLIRREISPKVLHSGVLAPTLPHSAILSNQYTLQENRFYFYNKINY